jgi:hypothetical protein
MYDECDPAGPTMVLRQFPNHKPKKGVTTMVTVIRTGAIAPGKTADALAFAHQITKLIKEKHGVPIELLVPVGGNPGRIAFKSNYQGLGEWETISAKLLADADYLAAIASNAAIFLPGSIHDEIWRTL